VRRSTLPGERVLSHSASSCARENGRVAGGSARVRRGCALRRSRARRERALWPSVPKTSAPSSKICRHLDGLPLALELAAARTKRAFRSSKSRGAWTAFFDVLSPRGQPTIARHETMRAVDRLELRLALHAGAAALRAAFDFCRPVFSLEVATSVLCRREIVQDDVLELLSLLIAQSLVLSDFNERRRSLPHARGDAPICVRETSRAQRAARTIAIATPRLLARRRASGSRLVTIPTNALVPARDD